MRADCVTKRSFLPSSHGLALRGGFLDDVGCRHNGPELRQCTPQTPLSGIVIVQTAGAWNIYRLEERLRHRPGGNLICGLKLDHQPMGPTAVCRPSMTCGQRRLGGSVSACVCEAKCDSRRNVSMTKRFAPTRHNDRDIEKD